MFLENLFFTSSFITQQLLCVSLLQIKEQITYITTSTALFSNRITSFDVMHLQSWPQMCTL